MIGALGAYGGYERGYSNGISDVGYDIGCSVGISVGKDVRTLAIFMDVGTVVASEVHSYVLRWWWWA